MKRNKTTEGEKISMKKMQWQKRKKKKLNFAGCKEVSSEMKQDYWKNQGKSEKLQKWKQ